MVFLILLVFPVLIALAALLFGGKDYYGLHRVTRKEFFIHLTIQVIIAGVSVGVIYWQNIDDVEIWNGRVAKKTKELVPCIHSYPCNCQPVCSGSGTSRICTTVCQICFIHPYDFDWVLTTSNHERLEIQRIDSQGIYEPPRFARAKIGDTTAVTHSYTNYIKGSADTLFRKQGLAEKYKRELPNYPDDIYDYHHLNRAVGLPKSWNAPLEETNADMGRVKQANIILVATRQKSPEYGYALEQHWVGGKKNDIVVVMGVSSEAVKWCYVIAWADKAIFKIKLRDAIMEIGTLDQERILEAVRINVSKYFQRKPMKDFDYLAASITPTVTQWVISMLVGVISSMGLAFIFWKKDIA